jgi:hypothetical protein
MRPQRRACGRTSFGGAGIQRVLSRQLVMQALPFAPLPANAFHLAEAGRREAWGLGCTLDGSVASLSMLDALLDQLRARGATLGTASNLLVCLGAYAGEVIRAALGGTWLRSDETPFAATAPGGPPLVLSVGGGLANPIGKCMRRIDDPTESVAVYFTQLASIARGQSPHAAFGVAGREMPLSAVVAASRPWWVPQRPLEFHGWSPTAECVPHFVEVASEYGKEVELRLDQSPKSLVYADAMLEAIVEKPDTEEITFYLGCYAGAVFARALSLPWIDHGAQEGFPRPALWHNGGLLDPVAQVFAWRHGKEPPQLAPWYRTLTGRDPFFG